MKKFVLLGALFVLIMDLSAQNMIIISKPELSFSDNIITVKYDITGCGSGEYIDVKLIVLNSKGDTIRPRNITGDIGSMVNCGLNKTISWNLARDNVKIDEEIQILVVGKKSVPAISDINTGKLKVFKRGNIIVSVLLPGLGQKKASGKSAYYIFSVLVYGSLGTSLVLNLKSGSLKENYIAASGDERDILFNKWEKNYYLTKYLTFGAAGIWATNFMWSAIMPLKKDSQKRMNFSLISSGQNDYLISAKWIF